MILTQRDINYLNSKVKDLWFLDRSAPYMGMARPYVIVFQGSPLRLLYTHGSAPAYSNISKH